MNLLKRNQHLMCFGHAMNVIKHEILTILNQNSKYSIVHNAYIVVALYVLFARMIFSIFKIKMVYLISQQLLFHKTDKFNVV